MLKGQWEQIQAGLLSHGHHLSKVHNLSPINLGAPGKKSIFLNNRKHTGNMSSVNLAVYMLDIPLFIFWDTSGNILICFESWSQLLSCTTWKLRMNWEMHMRKIMNTTNFLPLKQMYLHNTHQNRTLMCLSYGTRQYSTSSKRKSWIWNWLNTSGMNLALRGTNDCVSQLIFVFVFLSLPIGNLYGSL